MEDEYLEDLYESRDYWDSYYEEYYEYDPIPCGECGGEFGDWEEFNAHECVELGNELPVDEPNES